MIPEDYVVVCPQCSQDCTGMDFYRDLREVYPKIPMWEGGPVVEATWEEPMLIPENDRIIFHPCGHTLPTAGLTILARSVS